MGLTQVEKEDYFLFQNRGMWNTIYIFLYILLFEQNRQLFDSTSV